VTYVEWLRVAATLKRTAITLGAIVLIAIIARICLSFYGPVDAVSYVRSLQNDPASHVTARTLSNGATETTIDSPQGFHVVVTDYGHGHKVIHMLADHGIDRRPMGMYGDGSMRHTTTGTHTETVVETKNDSDKQMASEFGLAGLVALIVGMTLAGGFARENEGHLEIALTRPVSRTALAIGMMLVDAAGIFAAWVMGVIAFELAALVFFGWSGFGITGRDLLLAIVVLLGAISWYAVLCCATASLKRNHGIVLGAGWLIGAAIPALARLDSSQPPVFLFLRTVATPLSWIDPFTYARVFVIPPVTAQTIHVLPYTVEIPVLIALTVVYAAFAIVQWRRVEA
jgi:hypothetical protein